MSQWYLSKNGQALGPIDTKEVEAMIHAGELKPMDLIYRQGENEWLPMTQVDAFSSLFVKAPPAPEPVQKESTEPKDWVLLKKIMKEEGGKEYKQLGPFSRTHVLQLLDQGEISFTDFAWKQGMESWEKIAKIEDFDDPLPSSPEVDMTLYEKTVVDSVPTAEELEKTVVDEDKKASLTELVNIERFDHQKTQVMTAEQLDEAMDPQNRLNMPINTQEFVTDTAIKRDEGESDVSLWSLEPPNSQKKNLEDLDVDQGATRVVRIEETKAPKKARPEKRSEKSASRPKKKPHREADLDRVSFGERLASIDPEVGLWAVAVLLVMVSAFAFYRSLQPDSSEIVMEQAPVEEINNQAQTEKIAQIQAEYQRKLAEQEAELRKKEEALLRQREEQQKRQEFAQKQDEMERIRLQKEQEAKAEEARKIASAREALEKKEKLARQAARMSSSKKSTPKKTVEKKSFGRSTSAVTPVKATGGVKAQSFYKQRDRKALFYSSLKAEQLAVEIEEEFQKLKSNKGAWKQFYGKWRSRVNASLASEIKNFPRRSEKYAYPKVIAEFKKDYGLFFKYGESFNAQVVGGRVPSGTPSQMSSLFARYKKQAQSLGR